MRSIFRVNARKRSIRQITTLSSHNLCNVHCVIVEIPAIGDCLAEPELAQAEADIARTLANNEARRRFVSGRVALRRAVGAADAESVLDAVLRDASGAPVLPGSGVLGSISHKDKYAVAAGGVAAVQPGVIESIGVDLELAASSSRSLDRRILTENEIGWDAQLLPPGVCATKLRFSIKEALYKALFRHIPRHIGFKEVEVFPRDDDKASVKLLLPEPLAQRLQVSVQWKLVLGGQYVLSVARASRT